MYVRENSSKPHEVLPQEFFKPWKMVDVADPVVFSWQNVTTYVHTCTQISLQLTDDSKFRFGKTCQYDKEIK